MMRSRRLLCSIAFVLGVTACGTTPVEELSLRNASEPLTVCDGSHALVVESLPLPPMPCKDIAGTGGAWKGSKLFSATAPLPLSQYCAYEWEPGPSTTPDVWKLMQAQPAAEIDCPVVATLAGSLSDEPAIWGPLGKKFREQTGRAESLAFTKSRTRVAVLDTAAVPYDELSLDNDPHGRAVGRAIADLGCAGKEGAEYCVTEISNHAALRRTPGGVDDERGGHFGTRGDLARALYTAVTDWQYDWAHQLTSAERLVVNMSLGWAPEWGGDTDPSKLDVPARAVWEVLQFVRCHGALLVAAAGNFSDVYSKGPMYPALWERMPAPDEATCSSLVTWIPGGHEGISKEDSKSYQPLVVAAGGVDWQDQPLANTRELGLPRVLAYGQTVTTEDVRTVHTRVLSGSSMSAAATSGAAATAWAYDPQLTATQLLGVLYDTATPLDTTAAGMGRETEFCLGDSCASYPPKRISACEATLRVACGGATSCPLAPTCEPATPAHLGSPPDIPTNWSMFGGFTTLPSLPCSGSDCSSYTGLNQVFAPSIGPQPVVPGCDICSIDLSSAQLWVTLEEERLGWSTTTLLLTTSDGRGTTTSRIPRPAGAPFPLRFNATVLLHPHTTSAYLDFVMTDGSVNLDLRSPVSINRP